MSGILTDSPHLDPAAAGTPAHAVCLAHWPGVELAVKEQDISTWTTWRLASDNHIAVVHLQGAIHHLETQLEGVAALQHPPMSGEAWVIPSGAHYASLARGRHVRYAEVLIDPASFAGLTGRAITLPPIRARAGHYDEFLYRSVNRLLQLSAQPDDLSQMSCEALSRALYLHFFREYTGERLPQQQNRRRRTLSPGEQVAVQRYVDARLAERITLSGLASLVSRTVHELLISFRQAFGTTPSQYIIERRLRHARHLLANTTKDLTAIALETGFSSHSHFSSVFRGRAGVTPRDYRSAFRGS